MKKIEVSFKKKDHWVHDMIRDQVDTKRKIGIHTDESFEIVRLIKETLTGIHADGVVYKVDTRIGEVLKIVELQDKKHLTNLSEALKSDPQTWVAGEVLAKLQQISNGPPQSRKRKV